MFTGSSECPVQEKYFGTMPELLERPTDGQVLIEGKDLGTLNEKELRKQRSDIAMIFQHFNLLMQKKM